MDLLYIKITKVHDDGGDNEAEIELETQCKTRTGAWGIYTYYWKVRQSSPNFVIDDENTVREFWSNDEDNNNNALKDQLKEYTGSCYDDPDYSDLRVRMSEDDGLDTADDPLTPWKYIEFTGTNTYGPYTIPDSST